MADIKWIKIYVDMFDHKKIKFIRKLPEGNDILLCWVMLLASAGKCNMGGHIFLTSDIPYTSEMLADEFGMATNTVRLALDTFSKLNMVNQDNGIYVEGWEEYQNIDGMEKIKLQNRERAKKHYDSKKLRLLEQKPNVRTNVRLTQPNATDLELDRDLRSKNKTLVVFFQNLISSYTQSQELQTALNDYIQHRKDIKKPIKSVRTLELILKDLDKYADKVAILNQSIKNGWQGIFELKTEKQLKAKKPDHEIFDRREYADNELEKYYVNVAD